MLNSLRYFLEVVRCGSIRAAAENLHVAPSAISRHIHNVELELGTELFERRARGVTATAAGEIYARYARTILQDRERMRLEVDDLKGLRRGHICLTSIDGIVSGPLSDAVSTFRKLHPGVTIQLSSTGAEKVTKAVRDGDADIGIAYQGSPDPDVNVALRIADPLFAIAAPDHPLASKAEVDFVELLAFPLALPEASFGIRKLINSFCSTERIALSPVLETNSIEALRGFARSGAGVTLLHRLSISANVELGIVVAIPLRNPALRRSWVEICTQKGRNLPIASERFLYHLCRTFEIL